MDDIPIPFGLLSDEQRAMVNAHVDYQLAQLDPDAKIKVADFKRDTRAEICTREGLKKLQEMKDKGEGPFVPEVAPKKAAYTARVNSSGATSETYLRQNLTPEGFAKYQRFLASRHEPEKKDPGRKK